MFPQFLPHFAEEGLGGAPLRGSPLHLHVLCAKGLSEIHPWALPTWASSGISSGGGYHIKGKIAGSC